LVNEASRIKGASMIASRIVKTIVADLTIFNLEEVTGTNSIRLIWVTIIVKSVLIIVHCQNDSVLISLHIPIRKRNRLIAESIIPKWPSVIRLCCLILNELPKPRILNIPNSKVVKMTFPLNAFIVLNSRIYIPFAAPNDRDAIRPIKKSRRRFMVYNFRAR
jgi:hypothetical protein